jgi:pimeloyl-ACP methyl ester carboxylesterase
MLVLLVHGLGRTPLSLFGVAAALRRAGHRTRFFAYSPTLERLPRIVRRLSRLLEGLAKANRPIGLIGHSLGGLLLRIVLPSVPALRVHHFIMLGTPNSSPRLARLAWRLWPFRLLTRECGALLATAERYDGLPAISVPATIIAGTAGPRLWPFRSEANDGIVAVAETHHANVPVREYPVWHTFMMNDGAVRPLILAIMDGVRSFAHPPPG